MSFLLPNAPDSAGSPFDVLDQSEPDSLDFQILGNQGRNYVFSGGAVTSSGSATTVSVSAAVVVVDGVYYTTSANATFSIGAGPAGKRFDLVVVRVTAGVAALTVVTGANDSTNPTFPPSRQITTATFDPALHFDEGSDVVLAALYRPGTSVVTAARIADKRVFHKVVIPNQGTATPTAGTATKGALYYKNNAAPGSSSSNLFVGGPDNNWTELSANPTTTGPYVPIGGMVGWPSIGAVPTGYLEASGQSVSRTTYSGLFAVYGTLHGTADGSSFNLPNYNGTGGSTGPVLKGTTQIVAGQTNSPGVAVGSDTHIISVAELPVHTHTMGNHTHTTNHTHGGGTGDNNAQHSHTGNTSGAHNTVAPVGGTVWRDFPYVPEFYATYGSGGSLAPMSRITLTADADHTHDLNVATSTAVHQHTISTNSQSTTTSGVPSPNTSDATGSGTAMSMIPAASYVRWIVRAL